MNVAGMVTEGNRSVARSSALTSTSMETWVDRAPTSSGSDHGWQACAHGRRRHAD